MTVDTVVLHEWVSDSQDINIPWPDVHRVIGTDCVDWLIADPSIEITVTQKDNLYRLIAEFYDDEVARKYWLMWSPPIDQAL